MSFPFSPTLHAIPRTVIREVVAGSRVRVVGTAVARDERINAPYTGTPCLAFRAERSAQVPDAFTGRGKTLHSPPSEQVVAFRVQDVTGAIDLDVEHVTLALDANLVTPAIGHVFGAKLTDVTGQDYREAVLVPDGEVAVTGLASCGVDGVLRLVGTEREPLLISNQRGALVA